MPPLAVLRQQSGAVSGVLHGGARPPWKRQQRQGALFWGAGWGAVCAVCPLAGPVVTSGGCVCVCRFPDGGLTGRAELALRVEVQEDSQRDSECHPPPPPPPLCVPPRCASAWLEAALLVPLAPLIPWGAQVGMGSRDCTRKARLWCAAFEAVPPPTPTPRMILKVTRTKVNNVCITAKHWPVNRHSGEPRCSPGHRCTLDAFSSGQAFSAVCHGSENGVPICTAP